MIDPYFCCKGAETYNYNIKLIEEFNAKACQITCNFNIPLDNFEFIAHVKNSYDS